MTLPLSAKKIDRESRQVREEVLSHVQAEFWRRGVLRYKCQPNAQTWMYDRAYEQRVMFPGEAEPLVFVCHRQLGKSHMSVLLCVEECLRSPGCTVNFGTDTVENSREIFEDRLNNVIGDMPPWISFWTRKNTFHFRCKHWPKNIVSKVRLRGLDYRRGDGIRGGNTGFFVIDEARNITHLQYVVKQVIMPMFRYQEHPMLILLTTPPDSMDHDFTRYYRRAEKSGSLVVIPASKNPDWTSDDERRIIGEYEGGKQNIAWRREIECEMVPDTSRLVFPEWGASDGRYVVEHVPRPTHYRGYVALDMGWKDHTGAVLALYDFENRRICALDELFVNYVPTGELAELLAKKIEQTFPPEYRRKLRILADSNALNLADFNVALREYGYRVHPARKYDREAAINNLRTGISQGRVIVQENCVELDHQLRNVIWNARRKDFERDKEHGHYDVADALIYLYRSVYWEENPFPSSYPRPTSTTLVNPHDPKNWMGSGHSKSTIESIRAIFGRKPKPPRPPGRM